MDRRGAFDLLIGSVAKHGETLAKCTSIFIEHGFPLMPVATPARMPTPLHAAAARGLHKLLNVLLAMDGAVELLQRSGPNINVWDGVRVLTVTGTALAMAEAASTVSMNKSVVKGAKKCQALLSASANLVAHAAAARRYMYISTGEANNESFFLLPFSSY